MVSTHITKPTKSEYDKWVQFLRPEYNFIKNYIITLNKYYNKTIEEYKKTKIKELKQDLFKKIKLAVNVKKYSILFCNICDNNEKTQFEQMDKPFQILEVIQMTIRAVHRRQSRDFPVLNKEQKELVEAEEKESKKYSEFLSKKNIPIRKTIQKNKIHKNNKSEKENIAYEVITTILSIAEKKK